MPDAIVPLGGRSLAPRLADLIRETRILVGWTQRDLARRAGVSHAAICRIETMQAGVIDVLVVERMLGALGMRAALHVDGPHLADRRRQRDAVHARVDGFLARWFGSDGWLTATEVEVGKGAPHGWIDLLAFRPADRALVVDETKTDLQDVGGLQRSVAFYEREARTAANRLGWNPTRVVVLVTLLDTAVVARRLAENRDLITRAFPSPVSRFSAWVADPAAPAPFGWTLASCDPATRSTTWLRPTTLGTRRRPPATATTLMRPPGCGFAGEAPSPTPLRPSPTPLRPSPDPAEAQVAPRRWELAAQLDDSNAHPGMETPRLIPGGITGERPRARGHGREATGEMPRAERARGETRDS